MTSSSLAMNMKSLTPDSLQVLKEWFAPSGMTLNVPILLSTLALMSIGFLMITSASMTFAESKYGDAWFFVKRHSFYMLIGISAALIVGAIPVGFWRRYGGLMLIAALFLLTVVLLPGIGKRVNGSQRWLQVGPLTLQASEMVKFCVIVFFASFLSRRRDELLSSWKGVFKPLMILGLIVFLLLLEPDFGSSVVIAATVMAMLFLAGVAIWQFLLLLSLALGGLVTLALIAPYRVERLVAFLKPWEHQFDSGYQLTQSLIAFGRGEWFGLGLGNSIQKQFFLPEAHTDFIFAIIAEELGLVGVFVVFGLMAFLIIQIFKVASTAIRQAQSFSAFACFAIAVLLAGQACINLGVASGALPTKGLTMPFISYGGSSLMVTCCLIALVLRIDAELSASLIISRGNGTGKVKKARRSASLQSSTEVIA